jgi:hypothetical protein
MGHGPGHELTAGYLLRKSPNHFENAGSIHPRAGIEMKMLNRARRVL